MSTTEIRQASSDAKAFVSLPSHPVPTSFTDLGPVPGGVPAGRVLLFLNRTPAQQAGLEALIREQSDPGSSRYRHFLTPAEFGRQFGPADAGVQTVTQWLTSQGFVVTRTLQSRLAIEFSATAPQLEAAFQTTIHRFRSPLDPDAPFYANTRSPRIPVELAGIVKGVSLSNFGPRPLNRSLGSFLLHPPSDASAASQATPLSSDGADPLFNIPGLHPCAPTGYCYALVPGDYATIYDTKPLLAAGIDGTGVTIGIPSTSNIDLPTVQRFRTLFLPKYSSTNLPNVILDGDDPGLNTAGTSEAYIDVETAAGVAPNATVNLYTAANSAYTNGVTLALARAVEDNTVSILSVSYGECEAYLGSYNAQYRDLYEEAAAQGITVLVASGDTGSAGCDPPPNTTISGAYLAKAGLGVSGLASTPYNIAVGGTDFLYPKAATAANLNQYWQTPTTNSPNNNADWSSARSYIPEKAWDDADPVLNQVTANQFTGGGGGQSSCAYDDGGSPAVCQGGYPKPAWQQGFGNDSVRDIPDVALFAALGSNYSFYAVCTYSIYSAGASDCAVSNAGPNSTSAPIVVSGFGGTSVSTPLFAGILALLSQKTQTPRLGLVTPTLYPLSRQYPAAFHDISSGTNAMTCAAGSPNCGSDGYLTGYAAANGFDLATGLGSVDANQLVTGWSQVTPAAQATSTSLSVTPSSGSHGSAMTFAVNVTANSGSPKSGTIALLNGSALSIQTTNECASFPCTFSFSGLPGGNYPVVARFLGDGSFASSTSAAVNVNITPEASKLLILNSFRNNQTYPPNGLNGQTDVQLGKTLGFVVVPVPTTTPANTSFLAINTPPATGTFTISDNGTLIGSPMRLDSAGSYSFSSSSFSVGPHSLVIRYSGDSSYLSSDSTQPLATSINFTVIKAVPGGIDIQGLPFYGGAAVGYPIPLSLSLGGVYTTNGQNQLPTPSGVVTLTVNGTLLPPATLTSTAFGESTATATIPGNLIVAGANAIVAGYAGDASYSGTSTSVGTIGVVFSTFSDINPIPTTTSAGNPITFYLEVSRNGQQAIPLTIPANVSVTLLDGATPFATVPLTTDTSRISADAQYAYAGLSAGSHTITMRYTGDSGDLPSTGMTTITITPGIPGLTLTATPITFAAGASSPSAMSTLTLTPMNGFTGSVSLTCSATGLPGGSCSIPGTTTISGASASSVAVTVSTSGKTARVETGKPFYPFVLTTVATCLLFGFSFAGGRRRFHIRLLPVLLAATWLMVNCIACGSGGGNVSVSSGTYRVTVNAQNATLSTSTSISVTVQ